MFCLQGKSIQDCGANMALGLNRVSGRKHGRTSIGKQVRCALPGHRVSLGLTPSRTSVACILPAGFVFFGVGNTASCVVEEVIVRINRSHNNFTIYRVLQTRWPQPSPPTSGVPLLVIPGTKNQIQRRQYEAIITKTRGQYYLRMQVENPPKT